MANKLLKSLKFPGLIDTYILGDTGLDTPGAAADSKTTGDALAGKANIDGSYDNLTAGNAKQLVSTVRANDKVPYNFRTSGGSVDIGDREYINAITGGSLAWNQLVDSPSTMTSTKGLANGSEIITGHKYLFIYNCKLVGEVSSALFFYIKKAGEIVVNAWIVSSPLQSGQACKIWNATVDATADGNANGNNSAWVYVYNYSADKITDQSLNVIDLTQMFGSTIADYIYSLETSHAGDGVAWFKKLFPKPYYAYDSGSIQSVKTSKHKTVGFNAWDEEWEVGGISSVTGENITNDSVFRSKNYIPIVEGQTYYFKSGTSDTIGLRFYDSNKSIIGDLAASSNQIISTYFPSETAYLRFVDASRNSYNHDICINLSWDGSRNGEYEPYSAHEYALDSDLTLRGIPKLDANNSLYYDGDTYESDGTVTRKYEVVDLGTLTWELHSSGIFIAYTSLGVKTRGEQIVCPKYISSGNVSAVNMPDKTAQVHPNGGSGGVWVKDSAYTDAATFKTAMSGVYLVYELATPTTETADSYQSPQIVDDFGTEEYVDTRDVAIPVGHDTDYPVSLVAKLEMAPDSPNQGNGDYIVRQTNGENAYVPLVIEDALPTMPTTAGKYKLVVTIADGSDPSLDWEADE